MYNYIFYINSKIALTYSKTEVTSYNSKEAHPKNKKGTILVFTIGILPTLVFYQRWYFTHVVNK